MQKKIIYFSLILFFSCNYKPFSEGEVNEIVIITSKDDKTTIIPIIEEMFSEVVYTPQIEKKYQLKWVDISEIEKYKLYSNLFIVSIEQSIDSTVDALFDKFADKQGVDSNIFSAKNVFSISQIVLCVKVFDSIHLKEMLITNIDWIINEFNQTIYSNVLEYLTSKGNNDHLEDLLYQKLSLSSTIGKDYKLIKTNSTGEFVWLGRGYPYRWLIFTKLDDKIELGPDGMWRELIRLYEINLPDIKISSKFRSSNLEKNCQNKTIRCLRGLYDHLPSDTGGPFVSYIIEDNNRNEVILVSGFVNFPENNKYKLLQQLEVIIKDLKFEKRSQNGT